MRYDWVTVGQQEDQIRYRCYLGPVMLNLVEDHWDGDVLFMRGAVYRWESGTRTWDCGEEIFISTTKMSSWQRVLQGDLEDWYATNILIEDMLGEYNVALP
jgi:hypothetical protein